MAQTDSQLYVYAKGLILPLLQFINFFSIIIQFAYELQSTSYIEIMRINFMAAGFRQSWFMLILWLVFFQIGVYWRYWTIERISCV
jgi:hypothetical protein